MHTLKTECKTCNEIALVEIGIVSSERDVCGSGCCESETKLYQCLSCATVALND
jgi:hypothetical protein